MKENIKKLQETLKNLGWKNRSDTWYLENTPYCLMIGFQKSNFSPVYYFEIAYVEINKVKDYRFSNSLFRKRITNKDFGFIDYSPENIEQTFQLEEEFKRITTLVKDIKTRDDMISFIMTEIIVLEQGINPRQKELLELIP